MFLNSTREAGCVLMMGSPGAGAPSIVSATLSLVAEPWRLVTMTE